MRYNLKQDLALMWDDTCDIYSCDKSINASTKRTEFTEELIYSNVACKLSFTTFDPTTGTVHVDEQSQSAKLFLDNELNIPMGSKVVVTRGERTYSYRVGEIGLFPSHQELRLTLLERWV